MSFWGFLRQQSHLTFSNLIVEEVFHACELVPVGEYLKRIKPHRSFVHHDFRPQYAETGLPPTHAQMKHCNCTSWNLTVYKDKQWFLTLIRQIQMKLTVNVRRKNEEYKINSPVWGFFFSKSSLHLLSVILFTCKRWTMLICSFFGNFVI